MRVPERLHLLRGRRDATLRRFFGAGIFYLITPSAARPPACDYTYIHTSKPASETHKWLELNELLVYRQWYSL